MPAENPDPGRTESHLRDELRRGELPGGAPGIDLPGVLSRSARRRLPTQIVLGAGVTLAIAGIGIAGFTGIRGLGGASAGSASDSPSLTESGGGSEESALSRAPADKINLCGGPLADVAPSEGGLIATTSFADAPVGSSRIDGTVTLTNTGGQRITGTTPTTPAITLSQGGLVLWHTNGPTITTVVEVDLAPGRSIEIPASFRPVACGVEDDSAESFRSDLPAVPAGTYEVSAALDLLVADGTPVLVTGPLESVSLG